MTLSNCDNSPKMADSMDHLGAQLSDINYRIKSMTNKSAHLRNDLVNEKRACAQNAPYPHSQNAHGMCVLGTHSADLAILIII